MNKRFGIFAAALLAVLIAGSAFCGGSSQQGAAATAPGGVIELELMQPGWINTPRDDRDIYQKWMNETFNVNFTLTSLGADFANQYMVRFASDDAPDMIVFNTKTQLDTLYDQGVVLKDWNQYLSRIPTWKAMMDPDAFTLLTTPDGSLQSLCGMEEPNIGGFKIRRDWLDTLGLAVPTTPAELLAVGRAFTNNDPDGNGQADTWMFTSAGANLNIGEIQWLKCMFGPIGFYINENGAVSHEVVDGTEKAFLDFMRTVVQEKLIDPDWYTIGWQERKAKLFNGRYGLCHYPGVLVFEMEGGTGNTGKTIDMYEAMPMPRGSERGGKMRAGNPHNGRFLTVSDIAASDTAKMDKILEILEAVSHPNEGYFTLRWGVGIEPGMKLLEVDGFKYVDVLGAPGQYYRSTQDTGILGAFDWGYWFSSRGDLVIEGSTPEITAATYKNIEFDKATAGYPTYGAEYTMLNNDPQLVEDTTKVLDEFEIRYIMGDTDDYDGFMRQWLSVGGQRLIDNATAQFRALGLLK